MSLICVRAGVPASVTNITAGTDASHCRDCQPTLASGTGSVPDGTARAEEQEGRSGIMMGRRLRILVWSVALVATIVAALLITAGPATAKQFATLDVLDGSVTRLDFDTEFTLEELTSQGSSKDIVGTQSGGNTFNRVTHLTDSQSRFEVDTPTATASVKGTAFAVRVNELGTSDIWVVEGVVMAVLHDGMRVKVHSGRGITIDPDGTSDGVYVLTDAQLGEDWLEFNLCTLDGQLDACGESVLGVEIMNPGTPPEEMPAGGHGRPGGGP